MTAENPKRLVILGLGLLALMLAGTGWAGHDNRSSSVTHVRATASPVAADGTQVLTLTLTIEPGWHLYANPVGSAELADVQTTLRLVGPADAVRVDYPVGREEPSDVVGPHRIYEKQAVIKATFRRGSTDVPIEAHLRFQACSDKTCLPPSSVMVKLPAMP